MSVATSRQLADLFPSILSLAFPSVDLQLSHHQANFEPPFLACSCLETSCQSSKQHAMVNSQPLDVVLDSPEVVLRTSASTDTEAEPAALSGNLILRLTERTDIKDIS